MLTQDIANDLMQRSMLTGVPTSTFDSYSGYDAVKAMYDSGGGAYVPSQSYIQQYGPQIAATGVGNLSYAPPVTASGIQNMQSNGIGMDTISNYINQLNSGSFPNYYANSFQKPTTNPVTNQTTTPANSQTENLSSLFPRANWGNYQTSSRGGRYFDPTSGKYQGIGNLYQTQTASL